MSDRKDLPPATSSSFLARVREELAIMMGNRGEPLDQTVRFKDLYDSNLLKLDPGFVAGNPSNRPIIAGPGPGAATYVVDLTPPPTPTGFTASAAISNLMLQTDAPLFTVGHGYQRTVLYGASRTSLATPAPTFANAIELTQFIGTVGAYPTNPATIWHLWVKWRTVDGVLSESPAGGTNGVSVTTGQDVAQLLTALTGQITSGQLFSALGSRIDLIDTPSTGLVDKVAATSVRVDVVQASVKSGGGNQLYNPEFATSLDGWDCFSANMPVQTMRRNLDPLYTLGEGTAYVAEILPYNASYTAASYVDLASKKQPATAGERYEASIYLGSHRCKAMVYLAFLNAAGTEIGFIYDPADPKAVADNVPSNNVLSTFKRVSVFGVAPAGTVAYRMKVRKFTTQQGSSDSYMFLTRGYEGVATSTQMTPSPYSPSGYTSDGALLAQYTVKVDVNGYVSGFGLASTVNNAAPSSAFAVRADQFYIASPSGPGVAPTIPFIVRTTPTTINGVSVPVGTYIQDAFIANGTITNAKIGNAQIDDAKIANLSVSKLIAGAISVGSYINSSNYVGGSTGWSINSNGAAEFNSVVVRGTVYASAGSFSGDISASTGNFRGYVTGGAYTGYAWPPAGAGGGFFLGPSGLLLGSANDGKYFQVNNTGDIYAPQFSIISGNASFGGTLQAAVGSFSGSLTANAVNAVNTINIAGNSVTVPSSKSGSSYGTTLFVDLIAGQPVYVSCLADGGGVRYDDSIPRYATLSVNAQTVRTVTSTCAFFNTARYDVQIALIYNFTPTYTGSHTFQFTATGNEYAAHIFVIQAKR